MSCTDGKVKIWVQTEARCCTPLQEDCTEGYEPQPCEKGSSEPMKCVLCEENKYQDKVLASDSPHRCKTQTTCTGPRGQITSLDDYQKNCFSGKICGCVLDEIGTRRNKQRWKCAKGFTDHGLGFDSITCYPVAKPNYPDFIPDITAQASHNIPNSINHPVSSSTSSISSLKYQTSISTTSSASSSFRSLTSSPSSNTELGLGSAVGCLIILILIVLLIFGIRRKCRTPAKKKLKKVKTMDKNFRGKLKKEKYKDFRDRSFNKISIIFQRDDLSNYYKSLGQILEIDLGQMEKIEQKNETGGELISAVFATHTRYATEPENGLDYMVLLEYLKAKKKYKRLDSACDMVLDEMKNYEESESRLETKVQMEKLLENKDSTLIDSGISGINNEEAASCRPTLKENAIVINVPEKETKFVDNPEE